MRDAGRRLELDLEDCRHLKNYLVYAIKYLNEQYDKETSADMSDLIMEELKLVVEYQQNINSFIKLF